MAPQQLCAVCTKPGTLRCSRCKQAAASFCGSEHQKLIWSSHKVFCTPNAPLVFKMRPPTLAEIKAWILTGVAEWELGGMTSDQAAQRFLSDLATMAPNARFEREKEALGSKFLNEPSRAAQDGFTHVAFLYTLVSGIDLPQLGKDPALARGWVELDPKTRNEYCLQALIACTLMAKGAEANLVELAFERLQGIVKGRGPWFAEQANYFRQMAEGLKVAFANV